MFYFTHDPDMSDDQLANVINEVLRDGHPRLVDEAAFWYSSRYCTIACMDVEQ